MSDLYTDTHIVKWSGKDWYVIHELTENTHVDAIMVDDGGEVYIGREIVLGERVPSYNGPVQFIPLGKNACPYCGNTSGLRDSRGMCVSCGGDLGDTQEIKKGRPYPSPFADWRA